MSKPKNAPGIIYWVEARYPSQDKRNPLGGKFTRRDMALRRRDKIRAAGGESELYRTPLIRWEKVDDAEEG